MANTKQENARELKRLFAALAASIGETLGSLVAREIVVRPGEPDAKDVDAFVASLPQTCAVARGALDKGFAGKSFHTLFDIGDAVAMAGLLMMTPDHIIAQRRTKGVLEGEDAEAFGELENVLYSGIGNVLREQVGNVDVRYHDHGVVKPGAAPPELLGQDKLVVVSLKMKVGDFPESSGALAIDFATAEAWNKAPLDFGGDAATVTGAVTVARADDEGLESIPAAPVRGTLAAFLTHPDVWKTLRRSCRRVGLELRRHGRGEIPNPAAHKNEIVLIDVPPGEDRRFDWCKRIKDLSETTKVALLLHHPSRPRVTQAFLAKADAIVGFPCEEVQLSQKLATLLPPEPPPAAAPPS